MSIRTSSPAAPALLALLALLAMSPAAHALATYDDFSGGAISPFRWAASDSAAPGAVIVESRRVVASGQLRLESKSYLLDGPDNASTSHGVTFTRSRDIREMRAAVTMRFADQSSACGIFSGGFTAGQLIGSFFNASGTSKPGSRIDDVVAWVRAVYPRVQLVTPGVSVTAGYGRCLDDRCQVINEESFANLGSVPLGTKVTIQVSWDPTNHRFLFGKDADALQAMTYPYADTHAAHDADKRMEILNSPAQCTTPAYSYGGADFDDVSTNTLP